MYGTTMTPQQAAEKIRRAKRPHAVYRIGRKLIAVREGSPTDCKLQTDRDADFLGVYTGQVRAEWIREDMA